MENEVYQNFHYIDTLKDMYLLLERCRRLAEDMYDKTPTKYSYVLECCGCIEFMCECTLTKLFNLSGGLGAHDLIKDFSLCDWSQEWKKQQEGKNGH